MRKHYWLVVLVAFMVMFAGCSQEAAAEVFQFDKEKVVVGVEFSNSEKDIDSLDVLGLSVGSLNVVGKLQAKDLKVMQALATVGYEVSPYAIPYAVLGASNLETDLVLNGTISTSRGGGGLDLLASNHDESGNFTYGAGLRGQLIELPQEIVLSYDIRHIRFTSEDSSGVTLVPALRGGIHLDGTSEIEYAETSAILALSKEFKLGQEADVEAGIEKKAIIDSITPTIGVKLSHVDLNIEQSAVLCSATISSEQNLEGDLVSGLLGANVQINEDWSANVLGTIGDDMSIGGGLAFKF